MSQHDQDLQQEQQLLQHFRQHSQGEPSAAVDALILATAREALVPPRPSWSQRLHAWLFGAGSRTRWSMAVAGLAVFGIGLNLALHTGEQLPEPYDLPAPAAAQSPVLREMAPKVAHEAQPNSAEFEQRKAEAVEKKAVARQSIAGAMEPNAAFSVSPAAAAAPQQMAPAKPQPAPVAAMADAARSIELAQSLAEAKARAQVSAETKATAQAYAAAKAKAQAQAAAAQARAEPQGKTMALAEEAPPLESRLRDVLRLRQEGKQTDADRLLAALKQEYPQQDLDAELKRLQAEPDGSR